MPDILHRFEVRAPVSRVFAMFADPRLLSEWWTAEADGVPETGETYRFAFDGVEWRGQVAACEPRALDRVGNRRGRRRLDWYANRGARRGARRSHGGGLLQHRLAPRQLALPDVELLLGQLPPRAAPPRRARRTRALRRPRRGVSATRLPAARNGPASRRAGSPAERPCRRWRWRRATPRHGGCGSRAPAGPADRQPASSPGREPPRRG
jgi:hypothetical protein